MTPGIQPSNVNNRRQFLVRDRRDEPDIRELGEVCSSGKIADEYPCPFRVFVARELYQFAVHEPWLDRSEIPDPRRRNDGDRRCDSEFRDARPVVPR